MQHLDNPRYCHSLSFCWAEHSDASEATTTETLNSLYLSHFLTEILHEYSLGGKYQVQSQNSDPAALQYPMQLCRMSKH